MSSTDVAYVCCYQLGDTAAVTIWYSVAALVGQVLLSAICLRASYAMSGTAIAHDAICLRARYALSGTGTAPLRYPHPRLKRYIQYHHAAAPRYRPMRLLRDVRY
eukprot:155406-Rhodomonas_salina.3